MSVLVSAFVSPSSFPAVSTGLFSTDKKEDVVHAHHGVLLSHENEQI